MTIWENHKHTNIMHNVFDNYFWLFSILFTFIFAFLQDKYMDSIISFIFRSSLDKLDRYVVHWLELYSNSSIESNLNALKYIRFFSVFIGIIFVYFKFDSGVMHMLLAIIFIELIIVAIKGFQKIGENLFSFSTWEFILILLSVCFVTLCIEPISVFYSPVFFVNETGQKYILGIVILLYFAKFLLFVVFGAIKLIMKAFKIIARLLLKQENVLKYIIKYALPLLASYYLTFAISCFSKFAHQKATDLWQNYLFYFFGI